MSSSPFPSRCSFAAAVVVACAVGCTSASDPVDVGLARPDAGLTQPDAALGDGALTDAGPTDAGPTDAGPIDAGGEACSANPMTHLEIINACTDAEFVEKQVTLPLLNPDGTLPPLP